MNEVQRLSWSLSINPPKIIQLSSQQRYGARIITQPSKRGMLHKCRISITQLFQVLPISNLLCLSSLTGVMSNQIVVVFMHT